MAQLIIIYVILAVVHYVYETAVAPSLRMVLRYEFFELRDQLRNIRIQKPEALDKKLFSIMDSKISSFIRVIPFCSISQLVDIFKKASRPQDEDCPVDNSWDEIETHSLEELKIIRNKTILLSAKALLINSGGWLIYIPIIIPLFAILFLIIFIHSVNLNKVIDHLLFYISLNQKPRTARNQLITPDLEYF